MRVLFVCTGNTCRSPMAEGIFNHLSQGGFSRGLMADSGCPASEKSVAVMKKMGIDISKHVAEQLTLDDIDSADLILTMTKGHKNMILSVKPDCEDKLFTLGEFAGGRDVADPYGQSEEVYCEAAKEIYEYIERVTGKLK